MNASVNGGRDPFLTCWAKQDCSDCLAEDNCSWCPFTSSCILNTHAIPLLAPAYDENICPHWRERWELRTRPLGCNVSTITTLTSLVTIASTLLVVLIISLAWWIVTRIIALERRRPGWWKAWRWPWKRKLRQVRMPTLRFGAKKDQATLPAAEEEPLLAADPPVTEP